MKREDVKNKIPGITDEQLDWLMQENGADITREKTAANALQAQVTSLTAQVATAQDGLKAFGEHKPEDFAAAQQQITQLQQQLQAQADGFAFDNALDTAILGKCGRSVKAVRALLDVDALKGSKDRTTIALPDSLGLPHEDAGDYLIIGLASAGDRKAIAAKAAALTVGCVECAAPEQEPTKVVKK